MLLINNLSFSRNGIKIFEDLNLSINKGQLILIKGKNGSGKTTLLKTILNILEPDNGEIFWEGKNIKKNIFNFYNEATFIMDKTTSTKNLTVLDNLNFWKGLSSSKLTYDKVLLLLETFNIQKYINTQVMYLSAGEIKKLELLRLVFEQKKIWILDEPYNNLDDRSIEILNQTFIDHTKKNGLIIFTSHYEPKINNLEVISLV